MNLRLSATPTVAFAYTYGDSFACQRLSDEQGIMQAEITGTGLMYVSVWGRASEDAPWNLVHTQVSALTSSGVLLGLPVLPFMQVRTYTFTPGQTVKAWFVE